MLIQLDQLSLFENGVLSVPAGSKAAGDLRNNCRTLKLARVCHPGGHHHHHTCIVFFFFPTFAALLLLMPWYMSFRWFHL